MKTGSNRKRAGWSRMFNSSPLLIGLIILFVGVGVYMITHSRAATPFPATRDKYKWPFSRYSIWNMPIGSNAQLVPAGFGDLGPGTAPSGISYNGQKMVFHDQVIMSLDPNAPVKTITGTGNDNWSWQVHVDPDDQWNGDWNGCAVFLIAGEENKFVQGQPLVLSPGGTPTWFQSMPYMYNGDIIYGGGSVDQYKMSLTGNNPLGCHGGSQLSGLGGTITKADMADPNSPIRHALNIVVYCHLYCSTAGGEPYVWPAISADGYWNDRNASAGSPPYTSPGWYNGSNPNVKMGSLLALKKDFDINQLTSPNAKRIAQALKDYGGYITDDSYWNVTQFSVEQGIDLIDSTTFVDDVVRVYKSLHAVTNNSPTSIGGGGNPLVCLAPPFSNGTDDITTNPNGSVTEPSNCDSTSTPTPSTDPTPTTSPTPTPTTTPTPNSNADITGDGIVGVLDLAKLISNYNKTNATKDMGDLNNDGSVTLSDLSMLVKAWGT